MKPIIVVSIILTCIVFSTALYNKNIVSKQDAVDSFCTGLKPIKKLLSANSRIRFAGDSYHNEFFPMSRFCLLPAYIHPYDDTHVNDTLLTVEVTKYADSTINRILKNRRLIYSGNHNGYIYKLSVPTDAKN